MERKAITGTVGESVNWLSDRAAIFTLIHDDGEIKVYVSGWLADNDNHFTPGYRLRVSGIVDEQGILRASGIAINPPLILKN